MGAVWREHDACFCFELPLLFASSPLRSPARLKERKRAKEKHREEMSAAGAATSHQ
jgi:hypothetical protein